MTSLRVSSGGPELTYPIAAAVDAFSQMMSFCSHCLDVVATGQLDMLHVISDSAKKSSVSIA